MIEIKELNVAQVIEADDPNAGNFCGVQCNYAGTHCGLWCGNICIGGGWICNIV